VPLGPAKGVAVSKDVTGGPSRPEPLCEARRPARTEPYGVKCVGPFNKRFGQREEVRFRLGRLCIQLRQKQVDPYDRPSVRHRPVEDLEKTLVPGLDVEWRREGHDNAGDSELERRCGNP
jgi:hypothetical protein